MEPTPMEKWTPREKREFAAQLAAAQQRRPIGRDVSWRGLGGTLLKIQESSKVHAGFIWDVRCFNGVLKLYVSTTDPDMPGFLKPGYREVAVEPAEIEAMLASFGDVPFAWCDPGNTAAGEDRERTEVAIQNGVTAISWSWSDDGPRQWREMVAAVRRVIQRLRQLDPMTREECARSAHVEDHFIRPSRETASTGTILSMAERPSFSASFRWDVRQLDDLRRLYASTSHPTINGACKREYQVPIAQAEVDAILASLRAARLVRWYPFEGVLGLDGTTFVLRIRSGLSSVSWQWWEHGPREWRDLVAATRQAIERCKQHDPFVPEIARMEAAAEAARATGTLMSRAEAERLASELPQSEPLHVKRAACQKLDAAGVSCPHCQHGESRFLTPEWREPYWICNACGRSFRSADLRA
jgi:hypothetical protein